MFKTTKKLKDTGEMHMNYQMMNETNAFYKDLIHSFDDWYGKLLKFPNLQSYEQQSKIVTRFESHKASHLCKGKNLKNTFKVFERKFG